MTSSLVGSEMCIRDRAMGSAAGAGCALAGDLSSGGTPAYTCSAAPVSYTHLTLPTMCSV
eukprot:2217591-Prorocentrum_lima.AAC.1